MKLLAFGFETVFGNLKKMDAKVRQATVRGVRMEMEKVLTNSKMEVPVDTGNLKNSAYISVRPTGDGADVEIGYRADYAIKVHEDLVAFHDNGKAKYLEDPLLKAADGFDERVAAYVRAALKGG